jgi:hypothetical protein
VSLGEESTAVYLDEADWSGRVEEIVVVGRCEHLREDSAVPCLSEAARVTLCDGHELT